MESKCKICRRFGQKLFLRGERCFSQKCAMVKRPYGPGMKSKKRRAPSLSTFGIQLREKQKVKEIYGLRERQFRKYAVGALGKKSRGKNNDFADFLIQSLESRLDNIVFRLGIAGSRKMARQMVSHSHFLVNGRKVNRPSFGLKIGDVISIRPQDYSKKIFNDFKAKLKKYDSPPWLKLEKEKLEGKIVAMPSKEEVNIPANLQTIGEFYSR